MIILSLILTASLSPQKAKSMAKMLLSLGATCAQADKNGITALHRLVRQDSSALVEVMLDSDKVGVRNAINHMTCIDWSNSTRWPLQEALENGNTRLILQLLDAGAAPHMEFNQWLKAAMSTRYLIPARPSISRRRLLTLRLKLSIKIRRGP